MALREACACVVVVDGRDGRQRADEDVEGEVKAGSADVELTDKQVRALPRARRVVSDASARVLVDRDASRRAL